MLRFYSCRICGNLIEMVEDTGVIPNCCGDDMEELIPGIIDENNKPGMEKDIAKKHIPVYTESGDASEQKSKDITRNEKCKDTPDKCKDTSEKCGRVISVKIGEIAHPMDKNHAIDWIVVYTNQGIYRKRLDFTDKAQADFYLDKNEKIKAIYAYCNLHGLWMCTVK